MNSVCALFYLFYRVFPRAKSEHTSRRGFIKFQIAAVGGHPLGGLEEGEMLRYVIVMGVTDVHVGRVWVFLLKKGGFLNGFRVLRLVSVPETHGFWVSTKHPKNPASGLLEP